MATSITKRAMWILPIVVIVASPLRQDVSVLYGVTIEHPRKDVKDYFMNID
jgi:hypothetical protein